MIGRLQFKLKHHEEGITVTVTCVFCGVEQPPFEITNKGWEWYSSGAMCAQDAFPSLDENKRELLISATCADCWETL